MRNPLSRIPRRLFGGHVHTGTLALAVVFLALLVVYGQRADHYARVDAESATPAPTSATPTQEYTPTRATRSSARPSSSSASTTPSTPTDVSGTSGDSESSGGAGGSGATTTSTPIPGLQLPTIPGVRLPGQTPTTPPAR